MKKLFIGITWLLLSISVYAATLCPNGTYVSGPVCTLMPDGTYR